VAAAALRSGAPIHAVPVPLDLAIRRSAWALRERVWELLHSSSRATSSSQHCPYISLGHRSVLLRQLYDGTLRLAPNSLGTEHRYAVTITAPYSPTIRPSDHRDRLNRQVGHYNPLRRADQRVLRDRSQMSDESPIHVATSAGSIQTVSRNSC